MVSFRRCILALAVLALCMGVASAQVGTPAPGASPLGTALSCTASVAVPPLLRAEGITELIGDIVLTCTGGTPAAVGAQVPTANITVSLGTNVTSRIIGGGSEALLIIDEPGSGLPGPGGANTGGPALPQVVCGTSSSTVAGGAGPGGVCQSNVATGNTPVVVGGTPVGATPNVFEGVVSGNQVTFQGVPVLAPVTAGVSRIYRITNIRANVAGLGGAGLAGTTPLLASVAISGSTALPINNPVQTAGFVQNGLSTSVRNASNSGTGGIASLGFLQCNSVPSSGSTPVAGSTLRYTENFGTAFKTRVAPTATSTGLFSGPTFTQNIPGTIYNSESGFILPVSGGTAGLADYGTRLRAVFSNIPAGVNIWVTTTNYQATGNNSVGTGTFGGNTGITNATLSPSATGIAELVQSETAPDFSNQAPIVNFTNTISGGITIAPVTLVNGSGEAVWEVVAANPSVNENFDFGVYFSFKASPGATGGGSPTLGNGTVNMSFAPVIGGTSASSTLSIPRFVDNSGSGNTVVTISICQTDLLFPFVTNENGFETGISIANTTSDPLGTAPQNGSCVGTFYGDNAVATTTTAPCTTAGACTGVINTGKVYANTLSGILGGSAFQGYAIYVCNFQMAHGFAFISDTHATNLAMGYLALIVNNGTLVRSSAPSAEVLAH